MPRLVLGGAQLGLAYGISNASAMPTSLSEAEAILTYASTHDIKKIDTAAAYGDSEGLLGAILHRPGLQEFKVITKTLPLPSLDTIDSKALQLVKETFLRSLEKLKQASVYALMVHHADDLLKVNSNRLYDWLLELKAQGLVDKIGCSFYTREQLDKALAKFSLDIIQVPANIFDQRLLENEYLIRLSQSMEIHVRSVFLQGLIFLDVARLPENIKNLAKPYLNAFNNIAQQNGLS